MVAKMEQLTSDFIGRLSSAAGARLISVVLYGSAASGDYIADQSDINLLCVFESLEAAEIHAVSEVVRWWSRDLKHRPPMVLTLTELKESADVFAIETLDIKAQNKLLFGRDVLSEVTVPMNLHRVQVEHELRILLLRLRQHAFLAGSNPEELEKALARSASSAVTLLRHALIVIEGTNVPGGRQALPRSAKALGVNLNVIQSIIDLHDGKRIETSIEQAYMNYMAALAAAIEKIDEAVPKQELQRVGRS